MRISPEAKSTREKVTELQVLVIVRDKQYRKEVTFHTREKREESQEKLVELKEKGTQKERS